MFKLIVARWCMSLRQIICLAVFCVEVAYGSDSNSWQQFRGNHGNGTIASNELPTTWSATENLLWAQELVGRGWSSPVIADGKIWVTAASHAEQKRPKNFQRVPARWVPFVRKQRRSKTSLFMCIAFRLNRAICFGSQPLHWKARFWYPSFQYLCNRVACDRWAACLRLFCSSWFAELP